MPISNLFYFYKDTDITEVLEERLLEEGLENSDIHVLGAMSSCQKGQLTAFVKGNREAFPTGKVLLIPYNIGYAHWVGILLEYDDNGAPKRAEYMDSMRGSPTPSIKKEISDIDPRFNLRTKKAARQYDFTSCGAYTIENLLKAVVNDKPLKFQGTMWATRAKHAECQKRRAARRLNLVAVNSKNSEDGGSKNRF